MSLSASFALELFLACDGTVRAELALTKDGVFASLLAWLAALARRQTNQSLRCSGPSRELHQIGSVGRHLGPAETASLPRGEGAIAQLGRKEPLPGCLWGTKQTIPPEGSS